MKQGSLKIVWYGFLIYIIGFPLLIHSTRLTFKNDSGKMVYVKLKDWKTYFKTVETLKPGEETSWTPYIKRNIKQNIIEYKYDKNKPFKKVIKLPQFKGYTVPSGYLRVITLKEGGMFLDQIRKGGRKILGITRLGVELFEKTLDQSLQIIHKGYAPIRKFIRNVRDPFNPGPYDIIHKNPYAGKEAKVRVGGPIASKQEQDCFKKRQKFIKPYQERFLQDKFLPREKTLVIACVCSGGGARAAFCTTGFTLGAKKIGLLDCVTYYSALSGSTWMLAPWLLSNLDITDFHQRIIGDSKNGLKLKSLINIKHMLDIFKTKFAFAQVVNVIDIYGALLSIKYLHGLSQLGNPQRTYLSTIAKNIEDGSKVIPIFDAVTAVIGMEHRWCWFTPWEFGSRWFGKSGAYIPVWAFGRKFKKGVSVNYGTKEKPLFGPMPTLGFLMAICGSAIAASLKQVYDNILKDMKPGYIKTILQFIMKKTDFSKFRAIWAKVFNFMHGLPDFDFSQFKQLLLADAGVKMGNPIFSTYRRPAEGKIKEGRGPDIIFIFDASAEVGANELKNQVAYAKKHNLPFPKIEYEGIGSRAISIFSKKSEDSHFHDYEIPTVVYMPRIIDKDLLDAHRNDPRFKDLIHQLDNFDMKQCMKKTCATFNFPYPSQVAKNVALMTELNIRLNEDKIKKVLAERRKINRMRDGIRSAIQTSV